MATANAKNMGASNKKHGRKSKKSITSSENFSDDSTDSDSSSGSESSGSSGFEVNGTASDGVSSNAATKRSSDLKSVHSGIDASAPRNAATTESGKPDRVPSSDSEPGSESDGMDIEETSDSATKAANDATRNLLAGRTYTSDFEPPTGFSLASEKEKLRVPGSLQKLLSSSGMESKQIWHISAPANISLAKLESVSMEGIAKGERVLTHKGIDYCLTGKDSSCTESMSLVIPKDEKYSRIQVPVARSVKLQGLNLNEHIDNADYSTLNESSVVATKTYSKMAPPEQPRGLRFRYRPLGVVEERKADTTALPTKKAKQRDETHARFGSDQEAREDRYRRKAEKKARRELKEKKRSGKGNA